VLLPRLLIYDNTVSNYSQLLPPRPTGSESFIYLSILSPTYSFVTLAYYYNRLELQYTELLPPKPTGTYYYNKTYLGDAHKILLKAVDDLHTLKPDHNYAKIIPIIQSSGTGKSRTVDNIGRERILFPMCLREDLGKDLFGPSHASGT